MGIFFLWGYARQSCQPRINIGNTTATSTDLTSSCQLEQNLHISPRSNKGLVRFVGSGQCEPNSKSLPFKSTTGRSFHKGISISPFICNILKKVSTSWQFHAQILHVIYINSCYRTETLLPSRSMSDEQVFLV